MFVSHKTVAYRLHRVSSKVLRVAQGLKGVCAASFYLDPTASNNANLALRVKLQNVKEWLDWAVNHLLWLEALDAGKADLENPPKPPEGYLW